HCHARYRCDHSDARGSQRAAQPSARALRVRSPRGRAAENRVGAGVAVARPLTLRQLGRATLARQMLLERQRTNVVRAVERLCGLQAQLARPPHVGLFSRVAGFRREAFNRALLERKLVRATSMRATLHVLSARDFVEHRITLQPMLSQAVQQVLRGWKSADRAAAGTRLDLESV